MKDMPRRFEDLGAVEGCSLWRAGLHMLKEIMEAHSGSISVTSKVNKGSVFTLRLPALA